MQAGVTAALCSLGRQQLVQATPPQYTESIFTPLLIAPGPSVVLVVDRQQTELLQLHWVETDRRQLSRESTVSFRIAFLSSQVKKNYDIRTYVVVVVWFMGGSNFLKCLLVSHPVNG